MKTQPDPARSTFRQLALSILFVAAAFVVSAVSLPAAQRVSSAASGDLAATIATPGGVSARTHPAPRVVRVQRQIDTRGLSAEDRLKRGLTELALLLARSR